MTRVGAFHIVIFLVIIIEVSGQSLLSLLRSGGSIVKIERDPSVKCAKDTGSLVQCTSCNEAIVCRPENGELIKIAKITCLPDSDTPYCNPTSGVCTSSPPVGCGANKFVCPVQDGVYPDPLNCSRYHICVGKYDISNNCPRNNVYDHRAGQCKLRRWASDCVAFNCVNKNGQPVVYPADDRIWGICINGEAVILGKCKSYEKFDLSLNQCVRTCRGVGNQPSDTSCQRYVRCAEVAANRYEYVEQACGCDEGYDEDLQRCSKTASCLESLPKPLCPAIDGEKKNVTRRHARNVSNGSVDDDAVSESGEDDDSDDIGDDDGDGDDEDDDGGDAEETSASGSDEDASDQGLRSILSTAYARIVNFIINNSGNKNNHNAVNNGDDNVNGNLVNGNGNGGSDNSGNVQRNRERSRLISFIINNSGDRNNNNNIANGNDNVDGNLVNGNNNGDSSNSGNVQNKNNQGPRISPLIINNSGDRNNNNEVVNGDDDVNGNLVNGNNNGDSSNSGNVQNKNNQGPRISPLIINNSGDRNNNNVVENGNDDVDGNLVNGNNNGDSSNSGNVRNENIQEPRISPLIINNSGNNNNNNEVNNGDDSVNGNLVNGNNNGDSKNSGNIQENNSNSIVTRDINDIERDQKISNAISSIKYCIDTIIQWIIRITGGNSLLRNQ